MKRTHWLSILLLVSVFSYLSIGCDDDVKKKTNNDNVNNVNNATCGNNILETGETCDGTALNNQDCTTIEGDFTGGTLACAAGCTAFDTTGCTTGCSDACELDNRICSADTLRVCVADTETGCTVWSDTDCTLTSETCQVIDTVAQCASCEDECTLDAEQCNANDDGIEACVLGASGCTEWQNAPCPQATPTCEMQAGEPVCIGTCVDECTLDAKQCNANADGIETCVTGVSGCTEWQNAPCDVATPECQDLAGVATCMAPNGSGETCADVFTITLPFYTEGTDFTADFLTADMTLDGTGCDTGYTPSGVDAVFAVDLVQDEAIIFAQGGGLDGSIYIQAICDTAGECLDAADDGYSDDTEALLFAAPADGTYYLIAKSFSASPSTVSYAIAAYHYEDTAELTCDDGFDNDLDDLVDCGDPDCFGIGPCTTETVCGDGEDNDGDTDIDCADSDCTGVEPCGAEDTEARCGDGVDNDLNGLIDCDDDACQAFTVCQAGQSCDLPLEITVFPFNVTGTDFYADYTINRVFTYSAGNCGTANGPEAVFSVNLLAGERINMAESGNIDVVIRVLGTCTNTNPTCSFSDDFTELDNMFTAPADGTYYIVLEAYYSSDTDIDYNFTVTKIPSTETNCTDASDDDLDTKVDCNDSDCFGVVGACETELNCSDGGDNDDDGDTDCDDTDCATFPACLGGDSCADALPVTLPFNATGADITADFTNAQTFTGTGCTTGSGVEAVFAVTLTAGQRIKLDETGALNAVIRVVSPCANATTCLLNQDTTETNLIFTAPADGVYYVVLEAYSSSPYSKDYNFSIINWDVTEANCTDTLDEDLDGKVDCNDPDCFGVPGACETELNCADGFDNDDDGDADCDDIDCAAATACELGESCINPTVVTTFPYNVTGTSFDADFANDHTFSSATCTVTGGAEAIFAVDLLAGERLRLNESGAFDAQLRVLPACTTTAPVCLVNSDPETNLLFTAPADGTYYIVLESWYGTSTSAYNFLIEKFPGTETDCTDTIDNDADGVIDCADSDCFGVGSCPTLIFSENFNTWPLVGWTIVDGGTSTHTWTSSAVGTARTLTGSSGLFAKVDSDAAGSSPMLDESLVTPSLNCTGFTTVTLSFRHYYNHSTGQTGQVDVSTDAGANWTNVANYTTSSTNGAIANINISAQAANQAAVQIRWHYTGNYDWYWLVDDVVVTGL